MSESVPKDEIPTDIKLDELLPTGLDLNDKQLLAFYRNAFGTIIARYNTLAKITVVLRTREADREATQKRYERIGYAVGAFVVGAAGTLLTLLINAFTGHRHP